MPDKQLNLREAIKLLKKHYGRPLPPATADPFELVLWENVAYLASPTRRRDAFAHLQETVGTTPAAILAADKRALEQVTARGILKGTFAAKLRECARIAIAEYDGDLVPVVRGPVAAAKKALRAFPGIGEPGAEKILLFAGLQPLLAPDSNGLRVLVRIGLVPEEKSYARTYAAAREAANTLPAKMDTMRDAHLLLAEHGRTLCKRSVPRCGVCPLAGGCAYARGGEPRV